MKVKVTAECIGCGLCETMCPQVFRLNNEDKSEVICSSDVFCDEALEAASACPVCAISVE